MRLHRLEVTAFGPFAGTESVDFDALADAGLFLLCGPTGAGKTSILDAVCFGLYGEVPGERNTAKRLRSDHAAPGVAPQVVLEVTLRGRRLRIRRAPAWHRPKRRGTGTTLENARVVLEEHVDGGWTHLSNRLDETGQMLAELVGMNAAQFTQVAMLPQGRFQSFLRAKSDDRHKVLQQLFRTSRFQDIEKWLVARRQSLRAADRAHQDTVASVVSRLCEAAEQDLPDEWELHDLAALVESGALVEWVDGLLDTASRERDQHHAELTDLQARVQQARSCVERARGIAERQSRYAEALRSAETLRAGEAEAARIRATLEEARRAAAVLPLLQVADQAARAVGESRQGLGPALNEAARVLGRDEDRGDRDDPSDLDEPTLWAAERRARDAAAVARALLPREAELRNARESAARAESRLDEIAEHLLRLETRCAEIPVELARHRAEKEKHAAVAAETAVLEQRRTQLSGRLEAAARAADLEAQLVEARARLSSAVDDAQAARERLHDIREARIGGMAAELALTLAAGGSCPVCGSCEHPSPAVASTGSATHADEQEARQAYEDADFVRQTSAEVVTALEQSHALARQAAGERSTTELTQQASEVRARLQECAAAAAEQQRLGEVVEALEREQERVQKALVDTRAEDARLRGERDTAIEAVDRLGTELAALFGDADVGGGVAGLVRRHEESGAVLSQARAALTAHQEALDRARDASLRAEECAVEHGFADTDAVRRAAREPDAVTRMEAELSRRAEQLARVQGVLDDPSVRAAAHEPAPDLPALEEEVAGLEERHTATGARARLHDRRVARVAALDGELRRELDDWAPTRAAHAVAHAVSTFAEGKSGDNALQMRLSAYVLAARLEQVVAAANERLHTMSDQRYTLEHSAAKGAGDLRGGLSLLVRDEWTGEARDPATLSGGETFVVSLALALGLADVVTQEAGGADIDTLFVDEGFGSLDPDTLDDVMDTLDELRDGGRVVGVVSHVPEMRTRITAQLRLHKDRTGSHVAVSRAPL
jgi:exonuclease SbcC